MKQFNKDTHVNSVISYWRFTSETVFGKVSARTDLITDTRHHGTGAHINSRNKPASETSVCFGKYRHFCLGKLLFYDGKFNNGQVITECKIS